MTNNATTERAGRALAVKMMDEIEPAGACCEFWPWAIEAMFRPVGTQQDNVVLRYLDAIKTRDELVDFCAVLTDYIGASRMGSPPGDSSYYSALTNRRITGQPGPWPTLDDEEKESKAAFDSFLANVVAPERDSTIRNY